MDLRAYLDHRIEDLNVQLERVQSLYHLVDEVILARSFYRASAITPPPTDHVAPPDEAIEEIPIKTSTGLLLAHTQVQGNEVRILPVRALALSVKTPPFQSFLLNRILDPMRERSRDELHKGNIAPTAAFTYDVVTDGDTLQSIVITNYDTRQRLREIVSSSRWTFEKMYERESASR